MARKLNTGVAPTIQVVDMETRRLLEAERIRTGDETTSATARRLIIQALAHNEAERKFSRRRTG